MATDGDKHALTYSHSGSDATSFNIDSRTGKLTTAEALDFETDSRIYNIVVAAKDPDNQTATIDVEISLKDVTEANNEAPRFVDENDDTITRTSFGVGENSEDLFVGQVEALDTNSDDVTYTLGGSHAQYFTVGATTGVLRSKEALDFNVRSRYTVTITATDGDEEVNLTVMITLTDVNERPMFVDENDNPISSTTLEVKEAQGCVTLIWCWLRILMVTH